MKKIMLVSAAALAVASQAMAADAASGFNGFYAGVNLGGSFKKADVNSKGISSFSDGTSSSHLKNSKGESANNAVVASALAGLFGKDSKNLNLSANGVLLGAYVGYGVNFSGFYVGGEMTLHLDTGKGKANWSATGKEVTDNLAKLKDDAALAANVINVAVTNVATVADTDVVKANVTVKTPVAFGITPRFGYVLGSGMVYVKTGLEIQNFSAKMDISRTDKDGKAIDKTQTVSYKSSGTRLAFVPGLGYEHKISQNLLVRAEYSYSLTETKKEDFFKIRGHRFSIGATYKF